MTFDFERVLDILACPACRGELLLDGESLVDTSASCRMKFDILDGIPRLLVDDATQLSPADWSAVMAKHGRDEKTGEVCANAEGN